ncbi:MAG: hypothetical protein K0R26_2667 [Bacteroidota bacterium]|jgi:hypothetical protein|nr:hypothetical protein [Bacteroidota bacterium]
MENFNSYFDDTYGLLKKYTDDRIQLLKIQSAKKTALVSSKLVYIFITSIIVFFILMFFGFMTAYYLAEKFDSTSFGFAIVSISFIALLLLFIVFYKTYLSVKVKDLITRAFFETEPLDLNSENEI